MAALHQRPKTTLGAGVFFDYQGAKTEPAPAVGAQTWISARCLLRRVPLTSIGKYREIDEGSRSSAQIIRWAGQCGGQE
jgi:hypothetical protein